MKKEHGQLLTAFLAVLFGIFALVRFIPTIELAVGFLSLTFGLVAIVWAYRAKNSLSEGTDLRDYTTYFLFSLIFIVLFSVWDTVLFVFEWSKYLIMPNKFLLYPKYFFITAAYLIFAFASYKILYVGKQFGFHPQVKRMSLRKKKSVNFISFVF